jgi:hypothetical protein
MGGDDIVARCFPPIHPNSSRRGYGGRVGSIIAGDLQWARRRPIAAERPPARTPGSAGARHFDVNICYAKSLDLRRWQPITETSHFALAQMSQVHLAASSQDNLAQSSHAGAPGFSRS